METETLGPDHYGKCSLSGPHPVSLSVLLSEATNLGWHLPLSHSGTLFSFYISDTANTQASAIISSPFFIFAFLATCSDSDTQEALKDWEAASIAVRRISIGIDGFPHSNPGLVTCP